MMSQKIDVKDVSYDDFDWVYYIDRCIDLQIDNIDTKRKAWIHWIDNGRSRKCINPNNRIPNDKIMVYCTYFPQFHMVAENNISFYEGYTDIVNLKKLLDSNISKNVETPSNNELGLKSITDYDLMKNINLMQKQIDIIERYGISGFAVYYYWFSTNTITGNNMIMKDVINRFFDNSLNMKGRKVYFIWANESWSSNPAFGETDQKIENHYNLKNIIDDVKNLMSYFKHDHYLKIDNKAVLYIHHPWFMNDTSLRMFYTEIDKECRKNKFDGIHLCINSMFEERGGLYAL